MKNHRPFDPMKLDVAAFATAAAEIEGEWPLSSMERIAEMVPPEAVDATAEPVRWRLAGERRTPRGGNAEIWLRLGADTHVALQCQRCLQPVSLPIEVDSSFRFVPDEATAEAIDADAEEDILVLTRSLNTHELTEDELLLALPVVALHEVCPDPLPVPEEESGTLEAEDEQPHPFAALEALKRGSTN